VDDYSAAAEDLIDSCLLTTIGSWRRQVRRRRVTWDTLSYGWQCTAGYVVAWLQDEAFRAETFRLLSECIEQFEPDVLLAHSLGSLISYDGLRQLTSNPKFKKHIEKITLVTLGTQLANPFVSRNLSGGRLYELPVDQWYQLFNPDDDFFTEPIRRPGVDNFRRIETTTQPGTDAHDAVGYLSAVETARGLWQPLAVEAAGENMFQPAVATARARRLPRHGMRAPRKRALLVGINEYANPANRLQGCVNDVFLVSSVLQESGFSAEQTRIVLDDRATAAGIIERLEWLVDGVRPEDQLVFYFSGHGAQLPGYGVGEVIDRYDETLVPHDFDWSPETSVTDNQIYEFYSQLPYKTRLLMVFDCCHSGGIHRDGGLAVRGIEPPDDVRHRAMKWHGPTSSWVPRQVRPLNSQFTDNADDMQAFCGASGGETRLGRAMMLRQMSQRQYEQKRGADEIVGPYLPVERHPYTSNGQVPR
jgi:hypothetical protein